MICFMKHLLCIFLSCLADFLLIFIGHKTVGLQGDTLGTILMLIVFVGVYYIIYNLLSKNKISVKRIIINIYKEIMERLLNRQNKYISYYGKAEEEIINGNIDKNLWSLALMKSKGDEDMRKSVYIKLRAKELYKNISKI